MRRTFRVGQWVFVAGLVLTGSSVFAQQQSERTFTVTLPESQWNYIGKVVAKQPYEDSSATLNNILAQIQTQITQAAAAADKSLRDAQQEIERLKSEAAKPEPKNEPTPSSRDGARPVDPSGGG